MSSMKILIFIKDDLIMDAKDLRKAAFAVGFGLTMGNFMAACVGSVLEGSAQAVVIRLAKNENKAAQDIRDKIVFKYKEQEVKKTEIRDKAPIGIHV